MGRGDVGRGGGGLIVIRLHYYEIVSLGVN